jgi:NUMOD3 motif
MEINNKAGAKKAISKPGNLNPMFNKKHRIESKKKI